MSEEKKRGRPKGSKNKPKDQNPLIKKEIVDQDSSTTKSRNDWCRENRYLLPVKDLSWQDENGQDVTLVGFVEDYGDWDFGLMYPFFEGKPIPNNSAEGVWRSVLQAAEERINQAWVCLGPDNKPARLVLCGQRLLGNGWSPEKWVVFYFGNWGSEYKWFN